MPQNDTVEVDTTLAVAYLTISILVIVSNSIVVVVIVATRDLHLPTLWNLVYMGVFDLLFGLYFLFVVTPCAFLGSFQLSHSSMVALAVLVSFLNGQVTMNTALLVVDRYIAICWPLKYTRIITVRRFSAASVFAVILTSIRTCCIVLPDADVYYNSHIAIYVFDFNTVTNIASSLIFNVITFGTIIFCLTKIIFELYRSRKRVSTISNPQSGLMKFSFTIALSALVFLLSYSPLLIAKACNFILGIDGVPIVMLKIAMVCPFSNSLWNSIIYATTYTPFKEAFLKLLFRKYYREIKRQEVIQVIKVNGT